MHDHRVPGKFFSAWSPSPFRGCHKITISYCETQWKIVWNTEPGGTRIGTYGEMPGIHKDFNGWNEHHYV